jgi:hypothetical protein
MISVRSLTTLPGSTGHVKGRRPTPVGESFTRRRRCEVRVREASQAQHDGSPGLTYWRRAHEEYSGRTRAPTPEQRAPLIRSLEPGEERSWCYVDDIALLIPEVHGETRIPLSPLGG